MKTILSFWRKHKKVIGWLIVFGILFTCGIFLLVCRERIAVILSPVIFSDNPDSDDQRSAMWPMVVSMTVTLLGSIITTYVFSKDTMDHILDERPFYREVIAKYRRKTIRSMGRYIIFAAISIFSVFALYFFYYFRRKRSPENLRISIFLVCLVVGVRSIWLICQCIHSERHLQEDAEKQLKGMMRQMREYARCDPSFIRLLGIQSDTLASWLQIEAGREGAYVSYRKFVSMFSKWEELLILLAQQQTATDLANMTLDQQIEFTIRTGLNAYRKNTGGRPGNEQDSFEWEDARENGWFFVACKKVMDCEAALEHSAQRLSSNQRLGATKAPSKDDHSQTSALDCFMDEYRFLARCRDLCKVIGDETESDVQKRGEDPFWDIVDGKRDIDGEKSLVSIFYLFLVGLFTQALRTAPTIKLFFPAGLFTASDFYNIRFNDSLFRSSKFQHSIFARTKLKDSNFSLSRFEQCNFYNADCRDCTFTNTSWEGCFLESAFFENVDLTGAALERCFLRNARFHSVILQNLQLSRSTLDRNDFVDSRLENIDLELPWDPCGHMNIQSCNFSNSILARITLQPKGSPAHFFSQLASLRTEGNCPELRQCLFFGIEQQREIFQKRMDAFSPPQDMLFPSTGAAAQGHRSHPVWRDIENGAVILMDNSIFENSTLLIPYFYRVSLKQSVLINVQMDTALFFGTNMFGCIMPRANLLGARLWAVVLKSAVLKGAILFNSYCKLVNFEDADLKNLHASEASFHGCSFNRSDCSNIDLTRAIVQNSVFVDSILTGAELTGAEFHSVRFDNSAANSMLASYTRFQHCQLCGAGLSRSSFNSAIFEDCDFRLADCSDSTVANVTFKRCSFAGCNFKNTRFVNVKIEDCSCLDSAEFEGVLFINLELKGTNRLLEKETVFLNASFKEI